MLRKFILYDLSKGGELFRTAHDANVGADALREGQNMCQQGAALELNERLVRAHARALTSGQHERSSIAHAAIIHKSAASRKTSTSQVVAVP